MNPVGTRMSAGLRSWTGHARDPSEPSRYHRAGCQYILDPAAVGGQEAPDFFDQSLPRAPSATALTTSLPPDAAVEQHFDLIADRRDRVGPGSMRRPIKLLPPWFGYRDRRAPGIHSSFGIVDPHDAMNFTYEFLGQPITLPRSAEVLPSVAVGCEERWAGLTAPALVGHPP